LSAVPAYPGDSLAASTLVIAEVSYLLKRAPNPPQPEIAFLKLFAVARVQAPTRAVTFVMGMTEMEDEDDLLVATVDDLVRAFRSAVTAMIPAADRIKFYWSTEERCEQ
jgi:hypothetical protein